MTSFNEWLFLRSNLLANGFCRKADVTDWFPKIVANEWSRRARWVTASVAEDRRNVDIVDIRRNRIHRKRTLSALPIWSRARPDLRIWPLKLCDTPITMIRFWDRWEDHTFLGQLIIMVHEKQTFSRGLINYLISGSPKELKNILFLVQHFFIKGLFFFASFLILSILHLRVLQSV